MDCQACTQGRPGKPGQVRRPGTTAAPPAVVNTLESGDPLEPLDTTMTDPHLPA